MASLSPIQSVLAFLTIMPSGKQSHDIHYVARNMYLFPVAGLVIGAIIGAMAFGVSFFLHPLIVGLLVTGSLVIITGVHHTDALADFADGLMVKGGKEAKRKLVLYFAGMIIVFYTGFVPSLTILTSIIIAEVIAKYTMVLLANRGLSAWEGFSSPFTAAMKDKRKIAAATGIMIAVVWFAGSYAGLIALGVSLAIAWLMKYVSFKSFGGISGDVLGASNEVTRLSSLIVMSSLPSLRLVMTVS